MTSQAMKLMIAGMPKRRPKHILDQVAARLIAGRESLGLTPTDICRALDIGQTTWSNWEAGLNLPDPLVMSRVQHRFGISLDWIYAGDPRGMPLSASTKVLNDASES